MRRSQRDGKVPGRDLGRGLAPALASMLACAGELAAVQATGVQGARALAPQLTAPGGFGVLHDLRWLEVFNRSPAAFALEFVAMLAVRSAILTAAVALAWPRDRGRPSLTRIVVTAVAFASLSAVVLTPSATLLFAMAVAPLVWWFLAALVCGAAPILAGSHAAIVGGARRLPPPAALGWIALTGLELTLAGMAIERTPGWWALAPAAAAGLWNAVAWRGLVRALAGVPTGIRIPAFAVTGALAAVVLGFVVAIAVAPDVSLAGAPLPPPVIVVGGFRSRVDRSPPAGARIEPFSYRGVGPRGRPLPYSPAATYASLGVLARRLLHQTTLLHRRTGRRVTVIAISEGTMVAKMLLLRHPHAPIGHLLLLSPIVDPARVRLPPAGAPAGWGWATRFPTGLMFRLIGATFFDASQDMPLVRSMFADRAALQGGMLCRLPGLAQRAYLPLANGVASPDPPPAGIPVLVEPVVHGGVVTTPSGSGGGTVDAVRVARRARLLSPRPSPAWRIALGLVRSAAAAWQVPPLPADASRARCG
jgi:hypothetical protein